MKLTHAMLLAAGLGTRMRPLTLELPKVLIEVGGKTLVDWNLDWLDEAGIKTVVVNTSYLAEKLEAHLASRTSPKLVVSREGAPPLETGGGMKQALPQLGTRPFLAMNGDAILPHTGTHPVRTLSEQWDDSVDFLLLVVPYAQALGWSGPGDFIVDDDGRLRRPREGESAPYIFTGVEIIHPRVFNDSPDAAFSLSKLWQRGADQDGWFARARALAHDGAWLHIGDPAGLKAAEDYFAANGKRM